MYLRDSYKDIKVCVYAISAGEPEEFIDRWLASMNGADYICVLVTRLNDQNFEYFSEKKEEYPQLIVEQKDITPWRFDVARNESMKLIPSDSDVIISTDIDEILIPEFWDDLRKIVFKHPDFERIFYKFAWSHDDNGNPKCVFWYDKITQPKGWSWEFPVHETLRCSNAYHYIGKYNMDEDKIYLRHFADDSKSRKSYLDLLKIRAEENPNDLIGFFYLAREYSFVNDYRNALNTAFVLQTKIFEIGTTDNLLLPCTLIMLGDYSSKIVGLDDDAEYWYRKAIKFNPSIRDSYIKLAHLLSRQPRPMEVYKTLDEMYSTSKFIEDFRLQPYYWEEWTIDQIVACARCHEGRLEDATKIMQHAIDQLNTNDKIVDAYREGLFEDASWIERVVNSQN